MPIMANIFVCLLIYCTISSLGYLIFLYSSDILYGYGLDGLDEYKKVKKLWPLFTYAWPVGIVILVIKSIKKLIHSIFDAFE